MPPPAVTPDRLPAWAGEGVVRPTGQQDLVFRPLGRDGAAGAQRPAVEAQQAWAAQDGRR